VLARGLHNIKAWKRKQQSAASVKNQYLAATSMVTGLFATRVSMVAKMIITKKPTMRIGYFNHTIREDQMKTITAKIRYGKPEFEPSISDFVQKKYIYSPLLVHGDCDGKIPVTGTGTKYASKIFLHGAPQPASGTQKIELSDEFESPRNDIGYNNHGSFLKIIITE
jgi:hypothetical protein